MTTTSVVISDLYITLNASLPIGALYRDMKESLADIAAAELNFKCYLAGAFLMVIHPGGDDICTAKSAQGKSHMLAFQISFGVPWVYDRYR
jgi:hypothetical protein